MLTLALVLALSFVLHTRIRHVCRLESLFCLMKCRSLTQPVVHGAVGFYRLFRMCQQMRGFTMGIFIMTPACQAP